ncbi:hypothetical protein JRI60_18750 [Archangium violaceum]|uniref:hypothetical protein n=1 Tax=Archangium violaceum TaxID=83451 RepID=UPI0019528B27|nr:hypothetical protein [Archangium violaceum]QRO00922.1 hypothetical protein JRI60_18750 [Archangium violaceum]
MRKNNWLLGILMTALALSGCTPTPGGNGNGNPTADGGRDGGDSTGNDDGGDPDGGGGEVTLKSITISPANATLSVTGTTGVTQSYTVTGTYTDKHTEDVTGQASFFIDNTQLGSFSGSTFKSSATVGGTSYVRAQIGTTSVSTQITVKMAQKLPDSAPGSSTLPSQPESRFDGQVEATRKPTLVYPNSGVMVPPNLGQLEIHFLPGPTSNTLFELAFSNTVTDVRVYLRCYLPDNFTLPTGVSRGCIYTPSEQVWKFLAESNRGGQPVRVILRATGDTGGTVGVSDPITIQFSRAELKGALYYWTTTGSTPGVMRYDFADPNSKKASEVLTKNNINDSGISCVGCHALSRNGKKVVAEVQGQNDGRLALVDLSNFTPASKTNIVSTSTDDKSIFESWNPDGSKFVGVYTDSGSNNHNLLLFDGTTGKRTGVIANTGTQANPANHPDWSADGKTIAYTAVGIRETNQRMGKGAIKAVTQQTGGAWSAPFTIVPAVSGKNRYYPAIAPNNSFLVYNESTCPTANTEKEKYCNADTDPSAKMWAAKLQANATPVELARINAPGPMDKGNTNLTNSYPKWSPFVTRGSASESSQLMWTTFSSSRMYGLRQPPKGGDEYPDSGTLLWMAAVEGGKLEKGEDPSYAAFALPFQTLNTSNHIAQWAEYFVVNGCSTVGENCTGAGSCCNGLNCVNPTKDPPVPCDVSGGCVCKAPPALCGTAFEKCSQVAPCCDGMRCLDDAGAECTGDNCTCRPPCSGIGQPCGANSACCDGLRCTSSANGTVCKVPIQ